MKHLLIIGARGFGREVYCSALESIGYGEDFDIKGFLDDKADALDGYNGYPPIIDSVEHYQPQEDDVFTCALGDVKWKKHYVEIILSKGGEFINLIHKNAYIGKNVKIGQGCIILAGSRLHCDIVVGDFVTIQPYVVIGHDMRIGNYCQLNANVVLGGASHIGNMVTLNTSCVTLPKSVVEDGVTVGASSLVLRKVKAGQTIFGVPAKPILVPKI